MSKYRTPFNEEQTKRIASALRRTWDAIGYDVLSAADDQTMDRESVIECVLDCDYLETHGINTWSRATKDDIAALRALSYEDRHAFAMEYAFNFDTYGM